MTTKCEHGRWVYPEQYHDDWSGETVHPEPYLESTWADKVPGDGKFECTQCGEVGYYTGAWRDFWEKGTPCPGSDLVRS